MEQQVPDNASERDYLDIVIETYQRQLEAGVVNGEQLNVKMEGDKIVAISGGGGGSVKQRGSSSKKSIFGKKKEKTNDNTVFNSKLSSVSEAEASSETTYSSGDDNTMAFSKKHTMNQSSSEAKDKRNPLKSITTSNRKKNTMAGKRPNPSLSDEQTRRNEYLQSTGRFKSNSLGRSAHHGCHFPDSNDNTEGASSDPFTMLETNTQNVNKRLSVRPNSASNLYHHHHHHNNNNQLPGRAKVQERVKVINTTGNGLRTLEDLVDSAVDCEVPSNSGDYTKFIKSSVRASASSSSSSTLTAAASTAHNNNIIQPGEPSSEFPKAIGDQLNDLMRCTKGNTVMVGHRHQEVMKMLSSLAEDVDLKNKLTTNAIKGEVNYIRSSSDLILTNIQEQEALVKTSLSSVCTRAEAAAMNGQTNQQLRNMIDMIKTLKKDADDRGLDVKALADQVGGLSSLITAAMPENNLQVSHGTGKGRFPPLLHGKAADQGSLSQVTSSELDRLLGKEDGAKLGLQIKSVEDSVNTIIGMMREKETKKQYDRLVKINDKTKADSPLITKIDQMVHVLDSLSERMDKMEYSMVGDTEGGPGTRPDASLYGKVEKLSRNQLSLLKSLQTINSNIEQVVAGLEDMQAMMGFEEDEEDETDDDDDNNNFNAYP